MNVDRMRNTFHKNKALCEALRIDIEDMDKCCDSLEKICSAKSLFDISLSDAVSSILDFDKLSFTLRSMVDSLEFITSIYKDIVDAAQFDIRTLLQDAGMCDLCAHYDDDCCDKEDAIYCNAEWRGLCEYNNAEWRESHGDRQEQN